MEFVDRFKELFDAASGLRILRELEAESGADGGVSFRLRIRTFESRLERAEVDFLTFVAENPDYRKRAEENLSTRWTSREPELARIRERLQATR